MAAELVATGSPGVCSPAFSDDGSLFVASTPEGSILRVDVSKGAFVEVDSTGGQPSGIAFDASGALHAADLAVGAIMQRDATPDAEHGGAAAGAGAVSWISSVVDYEGEPMRGPTSLAVASDGTLFFTDSGPLGEATLDSPTGSVFAVVGAGRGRFLKPILLRSLAHPCGVATGADGKVV